MSPEILKIAKTVGIKLSERSPKENFGWDGKTVATGNRDDAEIVHDIAHWIVCAPSRRKVVEFGLGSGFDTGDEEAADKKQKVPRHFAQKEEEKASLLGILLMRKFRISDWKKTFVDHNWMESCEYKGGELTIFKTLCRLGRKGLITKKSSPQLNPCQPVYISKKLAKRLLKLAISATIYKTYKRLKQQVKTIR